MFAWMLGCWWMKVAVIKLKFIISHNRAGTNNNLSLKIKSNDQLFLQIALISNYNLVTIIDWKKAIFFFPFLVISFYLKLSSYVFQYFCEQWQSLEFISIRRKLEVNDAEILNIGLSLVLLRIETFLCWVCWQMCL